MTSELTGDEIQAILAVLNTTFENWGDEAFFRWKYIENPHGESLHMIGFDGDKAVASVGFWRSDLDGVRGYQCVDAATLPSHQRRGVFREAVSGSVARLESAYIYTTPAVNSSSLPGFLNLGWTVQRRLQTSVNLTPVMLARYKGNEPIDDEFVEWRFVRHPTRQYYVCRKDGRPFLLSKQRDRWYAVAGALSHDFGLPPVHPLLLFSYDLPNLAFRIPGRGGYILEDSHSFNYGGLIPYYRSDIL